MSFNTTNQFPGCVFNTKDTMLDTDPFSDVRQAENPKPRSRRKSKIIHISEALKRIFENAEDAESKK
jgi:hypothetical protein